MIKLDRLCITANMTNALVLCDFMSHRKSGHTFFAHKNSSLICDGYPGMLRHTLSVELSAIRGNTAEIC